MVIVMLTKLADLGLVRYCLLFYRHSQWAHDVETTSIFSRNLVATLLNQEISMLFRHRFVSVLSTSLTDVVTTLNRRRYRVVKFPVA